MKKIILILSSIIMYSYCAAPAKNIKCPHGQASHYNTCGFCPKDAKLKNGKCICNNPNTKINPISVASSTGISFNCIDKNIKDDCTGPNQYVVSKFSSSVVGTIKQCGTCPPKTLPNKDHTKCVPKK